MTRSSILNHLKNLFKKGFAGLWHLLGTALRLIGQVLSKCLFAFQRAAQWAIQQGGRLLRYLEPQIRIWIQDGKTWYANSEGLKKFQEKRQAILAQIEKRIIRFFHLEHLELDQAGLTHVRLGKPHKMSFVILNTIAILFVVLFIWSALADVDDIAHAEGRVIPSAKMQIIQNQEGGIIQSIAVQQGDMVKAGEVLLTLSPTQFSADFDSKNTQMMGYMAKAYRLQAEIDDKPLEFPNELIAKGKEYVELERSEYKNRKAKLKADLAVYENQFKNASAELEIVKRLVERGLEPKLELIRTQARATEAYSRMESILRQFKSDASAELSKTLQELNPLQKTIPAIADRLERTTVRSPVNGVVNRILVTTTGGIIKPGEPIVEVVPSDDTLVLEARVLPKDIGFVKIGQNARVKLTAYDYSIYGSMEGTVTRISADAVSTEERGQTNYYYIARIETNSSVMNSLGKRLPIIPGMQAQVDIITGHKTVLRYLLKPIIGVTENAFRER